MRQPDAERSTFWQPYAATQGESDETFVYFDAGVYRPSFTVPPWMGCP